MSVARPIECGRLYAFHDYFCEIMFDVPEHSGYRICFLFPVLCLCLLFQNIKCVLCTQGGVSELSDPFVRDLLIIPESSGVSKFMLFVSLLVFIC